MAGFSSIKAFARIAKHIKCRNLGIQNCKTYRKLALGLSFASQTKTGEFFSSPAVVITQPLRTKFKGMWHY
jgi:hypothetical protein